MKNNSTVKIILTLIAISFIWVAITSTIQRFKCDSLTETQILKRAPQSFILNFKICNNE